MNNNLVSIIIPIYKIEKYLNECIESVINQTYKNLEIILVNDGSPDNCPKMCDDWAKKDSRIKVIHKENGGVSSARNCGLSAATGDYCIFIDSDDYVENNYIEKLLTNCKNYDMVSCGYFIKYINKCFEQKITKQCHEISIEDAKNYVYDGYGYKGFLWNKLFKMSIIKDNNLRFNINIHMCEDQLFVINYLIYCKNNIYLLDDCLYYYRMRESSAVTGKNINKFLTIFDSYFEVYKLLGEKEYIDFYRSVLYDYYFYKKYLDKKHKKELPIKKMKKSIYHSDKISLLRKVKLFITYNFNFIYKIRNMIRKNNYNDCQKYE